MTLSLILSLACTDKVEDSAPIDSEIDGLCEDGSEPFVAYGDNDGDGYGAWDVTSELCALEPGWVDNADDCDDDNADVYPNAPEDDCTDPTDYNCDGSVMFEDADSDGFAACEDCDDNNSSIHPDAVEVCDAVDNDCDGTINEDDALDAEVFYADLDEDGYGDADNTWTACEAPSGFVEDDTDCDDDDAKVYPGAEEICDGKDSDCDSEVGELLVPTDYATLQEALDAGETDICLEAGTHAGNTWAYLEEDVTVQGVDRDTVLLDGEGTGKVLQAELYGATLSLSGLTMTGGYSADSDAAGLAVSGDSSGSLVLSDVLFTDNEEAYGSSLGVALGVLGLGSVELWDVEASDNTASGSYGTLTVFADVVALDGVSIHDNTASGGAGGMAGQFLAYGATLVQFNDVEVYDNSVEATGQSYAPVTVYSSDELDVANLSVTGNASDVSAGTGCVSGGIFPYVVETVSLSNLEVVGNSCSSYFYAYAAGLWAYGSLSGSDTLTVTNAVIAGNSATSSNYAYGGSVWPFATTASFTNVTVHGNTTTAEEAYGDWLCAGDSLSLNNVSYSGNVLDVGTTYENTTGFSDYWGGCVLTQTYSNVYDQGASPYGDSFTDPTGSDGNVGVDPGFVDVSDSDPLNWDLTLDSGSALIDAGDPAISDDDGTTSDIGAYGGPGNADW